MCGSEGVDSPSAQISVRPTRHDPMLNHHFSSPATRGTSDTAARIAERDLIDLPPMLNTTAVPLAGR